MSNTSQITSPRLIVMMAGVGVLLLGSLLLLGQAHAASTAPVISAVASAPTDTGATITWTTDQPSNTQVIYGTTAGGENASSTLLDTTTGVTSHTGNLGGLTPNTTYFYEVVSQVGNLTSTSTESSFMTTNTGVGSITASTTAPVITNVVAAPTGTSAGVTWTTDQSSNSMVVYGPTSAYGTMTPLSDATGILAHSVSLSGLNSGTTYHFAVVSGNGSTTATSSDMTFTTTGTAPASTTAPIITNVASSTTDTTATISWTTDQNASSQVSYGLTSSYGSISTLNSSGVMNHSVMLIGLTPSTTYHFQVFSGNASSMNATSSDMTFMTNASVSTSTGSTTTDTLQAEIDALKARVAALEAIIANLTGTGSTGTTTPPAGGSIDQNGATINAGGSIDLSGRNFGHEETVNIMLNGAQVATAHADGGGNFSTGSIPGPTTAGTYTYTFTGASSGTTASATITVH